jgi:hypothetical protein
MAAARGETVFLPRRWGRRLGVAAADLADVGDRLQAFRRLVHHLLEPKQHLATQDRPRLLVGEEMVGRSQLGLQGDHLGLQGDRRLVECAVEKRRLDLVEQPESIERGEFEQLFSSHRFQSVHRRFNPIPVVGQCPASSRGPGACGPRPIAPVRRGNRPPYAARADRLQPSADSAPTLGQGTCPTRPETPHRTPLIRGPDRRRNGREGDAGRG